MLPRLPCGRSVSSSIASRSGRREHGRATSSRSAHMTDANFAHSTSSTSFVHPHPVAGVGRTILFVTGAEIDWGGGGHELWSRTALYLAGRGISVCASVPEATAQQPQTRELQAQGVDLWPRPNWYSWLDHPLRRIKSRRRASTVIEVERLVR